MALPLDRPVVSPVIIGRLQELESLELYLEMARSGRGQTVFVAGEAGIGKSRLVAELSERARQGGLAVLQGSCFESDASRPFAPLVDLLRTALSAITPTAETPSLEQFAHLLGPTAAELVKLLPELGRCVAEVASPSVTHPEEEKHHLFRALDDGIVRLTASRPAIVIVEDAHWSDDASLDFLRDLARQVARRSMLLLVTYRGDEVGPSLAALLADLDRRRLAVEVRVGPLDRPSVSRMIQAIFGLARPVRAAFLDAIVGLTDGNPFSIEEVLRSMLASGELSGRAPDDLWDRRPSTSLRIPRSVHAAVVRRSDGVSEEARRVLKVAAVAGRWFDFSLLHALAERDEAALLELVRELIAAGLVVEESAERFKFRHALTREAVYSGLLARERRALHREIAETMEQLYPPDSAGFESQLADLAYHFYQAEDWQRALAWSQRAGQRAQALFAPRAASEHFTRALEAARRLDREPPIDLWRARGHVFETIGQFDLARADFELALEQAQARGDRRAEWQALLDLGGTWVGHSYDRGGDYYRRALEVARELGEHDPAALARSLNRVGNWQVNREQPSEGLRHHREALAIFQALDDRAGIAETLDYLGMASYLGGDPIRGTDYYQQAVALFRELDNRYGLSSALATLVLRAGGHTMDLLALPAQDSAAAERDGETALAIAREIGWRSGESYALIQLGNWYASRGIYGRAHEALQTALLIADEIEHLEWAVIAHNALGIFYLDLSALPEARRHADLALAVAGESGSAYCLRISSSLGARVRTDQGEYDRAESQLDRQLDPADPGLTWAERVDCWARAELALASGEPAEALRIADNLIASAENPLERPIVRLQKLRGEALAQLGRTTDAEQALGTARRVAAELGMRPLRWRIDASLGRLYARQRRRLEADQAFAAARGTVDELALEVPNEALREQFLAYADSLLPRPRPLTARRAAKQAFGGLTGREREVAALIGRGLSNRAIADALVLGERTVQTHVGHILDKLDFTSRAQIAAWAADRGLLDDSAMGETRASTS